MLPPSMYAHITNGILMLSVIIIIFIYKNQIFKLDVYKKIMLVLIFTISTGVHGISHLGLEQAYHFNPLQSNNY
jgi:hypothetical protein